MKLNTVLLVAVLVVALVYIGVVVMPARGDYSFGNPPPGCFLAGEVDNPPRFLVANTNPGMAICAIGYFNGSTHIYLPPFTGDSNVGFEWFGDQYVIVDPRVYPVRVMFYKSFLYHLYIPVALAGSDLFIGQTPTAIPPTVKTPTATITEEPTWSVPTRATITPTNNAYPPPLPATPTLTYPPPRFERTPTPNPYP